MRSESRHFQTLICLLLFPCISIYSQTKTLTLNTIDAGIRAYQTRDAIYFDPGYKYTATTSTSMHASTDPAMSCNTDYIPFNDLQNPTNRSLDQNLAVGATSGEFNVSATGGATYQIPIYTPSGTGGFQPQISLSYNSQGGNGLLGIGWNLSGISAITRVPQNYYNNTNTTAVSLNADDKFALDGNRLIEDGTHFHTEYETFSTITPNGTSGTGPSWFKVETREGKTFEYGNSPNSFLQAQSQDEIIFWYLNKATDNFGNIITYTYHNDRITGQIWLESIDYTDNSTPINSIKFYYENRQDKSVAYINGNSINNQKILNKILVTTGNSVARKYQFKYTLANNITHLVEIIEENGTGQRFNSTLITWNSLETPIWPNIAMDNDLFNYVFNDYNGDGFTDYLKYPKKSSYTSSDKIFLYINNKLGGFTKSSWELSLNNDFSKIHNKSCRLNSFGGTIPYDINNDGEADFIKIDYRLFAIPEEGVPLGYHYVPIVYESTGTGFTENLSCIIPYADFVDNGDMDGDGKIELLGYCKQGTNKHFSISNGNSSYIINNLEEWMDMKVIDFNGDGKSDLLVRTASGISKILTKPIASNTLVPLFTTSTNLLDYVFGDFNGDGKTDYISGQPGNYKIYYSTGIGFIDSGITFGTVLDNSVCTSELSAGDINGDGIDDIYEKYTHNESEIICDPNDPNSCETIVNFDSETGFAYILGSATFYKIQVYNNSTIQSYGETQLCDFDGNGGKEITYTPAGSMIYAQNLKLSAKDNMVKSIENGLNNLISINYLPLTKGNPFYTPLITQSQFPLMNYQGAAYMVSDILSSNGQGGTFTTSYTYEGALIHKQGKGFLGFSKVTSLGPLEKTVTDYGFNTSYFAQYPIQSQTFSLQGTTLSKTVYNTPTIIPFGTFRYFSYPSTITQTDIYGNSTVTESIYDNGTNYNYNGILTSQSTTYKNKSSEVVSNTSTTYSSPYTKGSPASITTIYSRPGESNISETILFTYNLDGTIATSISKGVTTTYDYTGLTFGLPKSVKISATGMVDRINQMFYDSHGRFKVKEINPSVHTSQVNYDDYGNPIYVTDANGLITENTYDGWGNLLTSRGPDGITKIQSISWANGGDSPVDGVYYSSTIFDGNFQGATYYDKLGRAIREVSVGLAGSKFYTDTKYNIKGQISEVTEPFPYNSSSTRKTLYSYKDDGRLDWTTLPNNVNVHSTYDLDQNKVTTTYNYSEVFYKITDASGLLVESKDPGGIIKYYYESDGKTKRIEAPGGQTIITYNPNRQQETLNDPDAGLTTYTYDGFHQLTSQIDANNKTTTMTYDLIGRIITKLIEGTTNYYSYDGQGAIGMLMCDSMSDGKEKYKYDELLHLKEKTRTKGSDSFTFKYEYDSKGNVSKVTYPAGMELLYNYNTFQELTSIYNGASQVWRLDAINSDGQIQNATYGNTKQITYSYDTDKRLTGMSVPDLIDFSYQYNTKQQLDFRYERYKSAGTWIGFRENFTYDGVNRLWTVTKVGLPDEETLRMTYQSTITNRIENKSDAGTYNYQSDSNHRLENINQNLGSPDHAITYTPSGKVATITETGSISKLLTLVYGSDNQRFKAVYKENNVTKYTRYYFNNYEKEVKGSVTRHLNYIYAAGNLVAIYEQNGSNNFMHYIYTDHLGSIRCITNSSGVVEQGLSYDVWGNRRDPVTGVKYTSVPTGLIFYRGYTGHEQLDELGLINMNGRIYDPAIALFLSPDNYVQNPTNSQNFNRYTYCLNNPLIYTDPSGDFWNLILGGILGGGSNWALHGGKMTWEGFRYFLIGATSGAIGAGISGGVNGALAADGGGTFTSGFVGASRAISTGFASGFVSAATGGFSGGFILGFGNAWEDNKKLGEMLNSGLSNGWKGTLIAGISGGIEKGIDAANHNLNFWTGSDKQPFIFSIKQDGRSELIPKFNYDRPNTSEYTKNEYKTYISENKNINSNGDGNYTIKIPKGLHLTAISDPNELGFDDYKIGSRYVSFHTYSVPEYYTFQGWKYHCYPFSLKHLFYNRIK